jgi:hypothetical protein
MPIKKANKEVAKRLENISSEPWLDQETLARLFPSPAQKNELQRLNSILNEATASNHDSARVWAQLSEVKDVAIALLRRTLGA